MKLNLMADKSPEQRRAIARKGAETRRIRKEAAIEKRREAAEQADHLTANIRALEQKLATLQVMDTASALAESMTGAALLSETQIVLASRPWNGNSGVYFLVKGTRVVYVGQALNLQARISQHSDKDFDRFAYITCPPEQLDKLEALYIHTLRPPLNGTRPDGSKVAPISLQDLIGTEARS